MKDIANPFVKDYKTDAYEWYDYQNGTSEYIFLKELQVSLKPKSTRSKVLPVKHHNVKMSDNISGKYRHFKGNFYEVYCEVIDKFDYKYVLYQQLYGNKDFWIRPYKMFFEKVDNPDSAGIKMDRFAIKGKAKPPKDYISKLISLVRSERIVIKNTENEQEYVVTSISEDESKVCVQPYSIDIQPSGYLTEYELFRRMGKNSCIINNKLEIWDSTYSVDKNLKLEIEGYDNKALSDLMNPSSIDLQIAATGFLKTKRKTVDPESVEHISNSKELWEKVKVYKSKNGGTDYFRLRPGQTIITHINNKIKIPNDCAGKIEIKSTYARLSLSITSGDYCNPGYYGYFPLEITNHGKHTILIHGKAVMAQLILVALTGPILIEYSKRATQKNRHGFDDGLPYKFWTERSIKKLRENRGGESIVALYNSLKSQIRQEVVDYDVNEYKSRFEDTFLVFCHNSIHKSKYINQDNGQPDIKGILKGYIEKEKLLKRLFSFSIVAFIIGIIGIAKIFFDVYVKVYPEWLDSFAKSNVLNNILHIGFHPITIVLFIALYIILKIKKPKAFCTFEKIDIDNPLNEIQINR